MTTKRAESVEPLCLSHFIEAKVAIGFTVEHGEPQEGEEIVSPYIHAGDYVIGDDAMTPQAGDIVVTETGGGHSLRAFEDVTNETIYAVVTHSIHPMRGGRKL